ncbi:MAG: ribosome maturation factor RimM, partial [Vulcanimicrobiaceae bacterium]
GLRGELEIRVGSVGRDALAAGVQCTVASDGERTFSVRGLRRHRDRTIVALDGIETFEAASRLIGLDLTVARSAIALAAREYHDDELIGLTLVGTDERRLGTVVAVEHYPAQDCLVVDPGRSLVPLVHDFIREIDLTNRIIRVSLPVGLLEREPETA